jgi:L-lactate dehydrogenase complex protein LldG
MSEAREQVMARVRRAAKGAERSAEAEAALAARLADPPKGILPARIQLPPAELLALFRTMAREASASLTQVAEAGDIPDEVARYLKQENLAPRLRMAPDPALEALAWAAHPLIEVETGPAREADQVSLTGAFAGIAETGTLMLLSGPKGPTTLNFLPETHIVVLEAAAVVGAYEDAWASLRAVHGPAKMPRTVNMITGPSRTGDIEQTIHLGAHGPRRLHIVLVGSGPEGSGE